MKKLLLLGFILIISTSLNANSKEKAMSSCKKYFSLIHQGKINEVKNLATGSLKNESDASLKEIKKAQFYFTEIKLKKNRAKIFVVVFEPSGKITLRKYYFKVKNGKWKPYRYRNMPFTSKIP